MLVSLGVNSPVLGDHLTSWDGKPEGPDRSRQDPKGNVTAQY